MDEPESRGTPGLGLASQEGSRVRVPSPPRKRQVTGLNSRRVEHCGPLGAKHTSRARLPLRLAVLVECAGDHRQVLVAEAVIDRLLPFIGQTRKRPEPVLSRLQGQAHILEGE